MRRVSPAVPAVVAAFAVVSAALPAAPAAAAAPEEWRAGVSAARTYAESREGTVAFAVRTERGMAGLSVDQRFQSASVVKAMLLVAYLRRWSVRERALRPADRNLLTPMVRWSSNVDATRVRGALPPGSLARLTRRAGMLRFAEAPWWGESLITARDQTRFFLAFGP